MCEATELLEVCTGCGDTGFACITGEEPYCLCEAAYEEWTQIGDDIVWIHD